MIGEEDDYLAAKPLPEPEKDLLFFPMKSPGMPLPGPDFVEQAEALGDDPIIVDKTKGTVKQLTVSGENLEKLYYKALYQDKFTMTIKVKARPTPATYIRGHRWMDVGTGPVRAKVMLVSKWPARDEVAANRYMVGPTGEVMLRSLETTGAKIDDFGQWYVTGLVKHPNLDPSSSKCAAAWVKNCMPLLEQELRIVQPDYVLALGAEPAKALISEDFRFDLSAGQVFTRQVQISPPGEEPVYKDVKIVACLHPGFVALQSDRLPEFQATLIRFLKLVNGENYLVEEEKPNHEVITTERRLKVIVDQIIAERTPDKQQIIAIDGEWHGEYPTEDGSYLRTIQFSHKPGHAYAVVLRHQGGKEAFSPGIEASIPHLRRLLLDTPEHTVRIAGHHLRADLPWITHGYDETLGRGLIKQFGTPVPAKYGRVMGGIDTMLAAHAVTEAPGGQGFKLEILAMGVLGLKRYDGALQTWKKKYTKELKLDDAVLEGYGECPDDVLHPYAIWDADATRRLVEAYIRPGGLLDRDQYGNSSWRAFRESMNCTTAFLEMEMTGIVIDKKRGAASTDAFMQARDKLTHDLRKITSWPDFNPSSANQAKTLLFGEVLANVLDTGTGELRDVAPKGASKLYLQPIKTAGKPSKPWWKVEQREEQHLYNPSTDKEVLGILRAQLHSENNPKELTVEMLRNIRFAGQVLKSVLREPVWDEEFDKPYINDVGEWEFPKGLLACIHKDGRVRTHIFQTKETGRVSSARPPLQNLSKRREKDYKMILGALYKTSLRSMITASPGYVLVEADYLGAELYMMAIQANDTAMIDHCQRSALKESDPLFYDIHSNIAVKAFGLTVNTPELAAKLGLPLGSKLPATKSALEAAGVENLRTAAKTIAFGIPYGRGNEAVIRAVEEEGVKITIEQADTIRAAIFQQYPRLEGFLNGCAARAKNPGFLVNCKGRYRRFQSTGVQDSGESERQAKNFLIQSGVASAVNEALMYLYNRPDRYTEDGELKYRMILQIHDAILFEVKIPYVDWFANEHNGVLKWSMTDKVGIEAVDLNGKPYPGREPFHMGTETSVMLNWGEKLSLAVGEKLGVPASYCKK